MHYIISSCSFVILFLFLFFFWISRRCNQILVVWPAQYTDLWDKLCVFSKVFVRTENAGFSENKSKLIISGKKKTLSRENNDSSEEISLSDTSISCQPWTGILKYAANLPQSLDWDSDRHAVPVRTGEETKTSWATVTLSKKKKLKKIRQQKTWGRKQSHCRHPPHSALSSWLCS